MKELVRMVIVLTVFCAVAGGLLAWTDAATKPRIAEARRAELIEALKQVLPPCDNDVVADAKAVTADGREWRFYVGRNAGAFVGAAFQTAQSGYGGPVEVLVGVLADGTVRQVAVLQADKETPGLGAKIKGRDFLGRLAQRSARDTAWAAVRKDGGEIEAITGATISSRAVVKAVKAGLDVYAKHAAEIGGPAPAAGGGNP
jgi:Na+-translocating ferredoxin:NAD+ oxidoreductase subunit G